MLIFHQLKQELTKSYSKVGREQGLVAIQASMPLLEANIPLLGWLKTQKTSYPHFFLQYRDTDQTIATIGTLRQFYTLEAAQSFIQQHHFPLIGGLQFEGNTQFILPQFSLVKNQQNLTACFYFDSDNFEQQAVIFEQFLANFSQITELGLTDNPLVSMSATSHFEQWKANIEKAIVSIEQGDFQKVVLANAMRLHFEQPICAYSLLAQSQKTNLGCYHFLWAESADVAFLGSTPERLYQRQGLHFSTEALAGTAAVTTSEVQTELNAQWLLSDPKNIYENQLVVDDIENQLKDCVTEFAVSEAKIKRLHNVQHLRRQIQATLKPDTSDSDCLSKIHPTAAVAGLPRQKAKGFITENEPFTRHWYAGTLGVMGNEEAEFCVTLRSALISQNSITLYAGAGIVSGSDPQSEWQEIKRKAQGMAKLLDVDLVTKGEL
ncbi:TPA: isochorismate synthase [Mannheimia haemolytica]|uniref:Isochorismate synthase MenF n=1 Tax=Mannheimia haemolytica TaxID=75985 RepID=A0A248ZZ82_MANHA|nr:isochorismate synthase [Mannheimia haemolytica]AWW70961.1 isochorismate synthase [Pasteurellaceae bacterium 12565]AGI32064.1 isochorismate synthase [Mannheimia haemolytica USDA-ARS-USMARC-183]AGI35825.1 isochorismate synthase [Mannheimia haemolytica USDA-ARS-USMARC-185]AGK03107.1 menaquinone-specific isochorismate synthase MenF [Mannheimia haemolytica M42548]AGQ25189.1 isochorismate synthase [Mannheimia haemolytica D153]